MRKAKEIQVKSRKHEVDIIDHWSAIVRSGESGETYGVRVSWAKKDVFATCSCPWGEHRPAGTSAACSHTVATVAEFAKSHGKHVSVWATEEDAARQHRRTFILHDGGEAGPVWVTVRSD